jgi:hypothetical protein
MRGLRQWFGRPAPRPHRARPALEELEEREVPSASTFIDGTGAHTDFLVDTSGSLAELTATAGVQPITGGVASAHAFRDANGILGLDIIYQNNQYWVFDSTGAHEIGTNVLSASTSYTASGQLVRDIVFTNGAAYRFSNAGAQFLANNILFVSNYQDALGNVGLDLVTTGNLAFEADSLGGRFLGSNITSVNRFNNFTDSGGQVVVKGEQVLDIVDTSGNYVQYSTIFGARSMQTGIA